MRRTTCPDNAGLVRLAETDQADGQHLSGVSAVRLPGPGKGERLWVGRYQWNPPNAVNARLAQVRPAASKRIAAAMITTTARITTTANSTDFLTEGLNSCASMRTSIVLRHRNVDGVHRGNR